MTRHWSGAPPAMRALPAPHWVGLAALWFVLVLGAVAAHAQSGPPEESARPELAPAGKYMTGDWGGARERARGQRRHRARPSPRRVRGQSPGRPQPGRGLHRAARRRRRSRSRPADRPLGRPRSTRPSPSAPARASPPTTSAASSRCRRCSAPARTCGWPSSPMSSRCSRVAWSPGWAGSTPRTISPRRRSTAISRTTASAARSASWSTAATPSFRPPAGAAW